MKRHILHVSGGLAVAAALAMSAAAPAVADESLGVPIITQADGYVHDYLTASEVDGEGDANLTTMYVDSSGAAHVAYVDSDGEDVDVCTIPVGASACASTQTLITDAHGSNASTVQSIKYLPDGTGGAVLAVGLDELTGDHSFDPSAGTLYDETEVFQPGATSGEAIGIDYDSGGEQEGDVIYVPDLNGLDVVGVGGGSGDSNTYEFESFTSPVSQDQGPTQLGVTEQTDAGEWAAGVTELANGATAVLAYDEPGYWNNDDSTDPGLAPVGMYVQPASGGAFGGLRNLGVEGPIETNFAPGAQTYLVNAVSTDPSGGINTNPPENLELYQFDDESLQPLGTIGATDDNTSGNVFPDEAEWDTMPPTYEDDNGNLYAAWFARGGTDNCPYEESQSADTISGCLIYREVQAGGVFGPKVVLSEEYDNGDDDSIGDVDQIAVNDSGVGWVLAWREQSESDPDYSLYAEPLSAAATVPGSPTVVGTVTTVPLTCSGSGTCSLTATLDSGAATDDLRRTEAASGDGRRPVPASAVVLGRATITVRAGSHRRLVIHLNRAGELALRHSHSLSARLEVVQHVGLTGARSVLLRRQVTLR